MQYVKQNFYSGQKLLAAHLNHIEDGIANINIDSTLKNTDQAADAKVVGDKISDITAQVDENTERTSKNTIAIDTLNNDIGKLKPQMQLAYPDNTAPTDATWSSKHIIDMLCPKIEESGNPVQCYPVAGYPLGVKASWEPVQEGEGEPSPENIRPIVGRDSVTVNLASGVKAWKLLTLDGTERWITPSSNNYYAFFRNPLASKSAYGYCSHYPYANDNTRKCAFANENGAIVFYGFNADYTLAEFKAYLAAQCAAGTPVQVAYKMAAALIVPEDGGIYFAEQPAQSGSGDPSPTNIRPILLDETIKDGGTNVLTLSETVYGGEVDAVSGEGKALQKTITSDGNKLKFTTHTGEEKEYWNMGEFTAPGISSGIKCSHFNKLKFSNNRNREFIFTTKDRMAGLFETVDELNAYIAAQHAAETPVRICYKLKEPVSFTATGAQSLPALEGGEYRDYGCGQCGSNGAG